MYTGIFIRNLGPIGYSAIFGGTCGLIGYSGIFGKNCGMISDREVANMKISIKNLAMWTHLDNVESTSG